MKLPGPLTADQERQLRTVQTGAHHLLSLINDLLDLVKIESGKVELHREPVVCQSVIQEVATALRPMAEAKGLRFDVNVPSQDLIVQTDRRALSQILLNLTNNAIKFTEHGSVCVVSRQRQADSHVYTEISVVDTGIGIKAEDQGRLFQAFEQVESPSKRRTEGTGLGLHLSQKLASLLGGRITYRSEYGQGSTFTLVLSEEKLMLARILVIEDNQTNLDLMLYLLRAFGYTPLAARDGEEALEIARREVPDLIICDVQLPKLDGYDVAKSLKREPVLDAIPLVAVTAFAMVGDRDRMLQAGFDGYIAKPIDPETFVRQVEVFLHAKSRKA
jgi:CheY-like chemotaxis protein